MKRKNKTIITLIFSMICGIGLISCKNKPKVSISGSTSLSSSTKVSSSSSSTTSNSSNSEDVVNTYTVIWQNHDGTILETDRDVPYGTIPSYDGTTPTKEKTNEINYVFAGWDPAISAVVEDITYTATFIEMNDEKIPGITPVMAEDKKTIQYGFYPQSHVNDTTLIAELNTLTTTTINGWYLYNGEYYTKNIAKVYNDESYTFDDGTAIVNGNEYWFKCEAISWQVLRDNNGYFLLSSKLLDTQHYYNEYSNRNENNDTIYANNYEYSDIRTWLNESFFNMAFALNNAFVQETNIDNSASTTDSNSNTYVSKNTLDKVYLPSYQDYLDSSYGFASKVEEKSSARECKTTDFARARGAWCSQQNNYKYNGSYWTRSPSSQYYYCAWNVNSGGYLSTYAVDGDSHCVRPCISITTAL